MGVAGLVNALECGTRAAIVEALRLHGPLTYAALGRAVGVDPTTVRYHVARLQKEGILHVEVVRRKRFVALPGQRPADPLRAPREQVLDVLRGAGGRVSRPSLVRMMAEGSAKLAAALRQLEKEGVVVLEPPAVRLR